MNGTSDKPSVPESDAQIRIEFTRATARLEQVTVQIGQRVVWVDECNLADAKKRDELTARIVAALGSRGAKLIEEIEALVLETAMKALESRRAAKEEATGKNEPDSQGGAIKFEKVEPAAEPVVGAKLLDAIRALLECYVVLPASASVAVALWIVHTWCFELFDHTIRIGFTSPVKRCGKTQALRILEALVVRPRRAANMSAAVVFRVIEEHRPTFLVDEADTFLRDNPELRGAINSGHERGGCFVRCVGDDHEPREFSTFAPMAIACIGKLPGTIEDRSIEVRMRRKRKGEKVAKLRSKRLAVESLPLRQMIARWVKDNEAALASAEPELPEFLNDRQADGWHALLAIADTVGSAWPKLAREAARALCGEPGEEAEDTIGVRLLGDIKALFARRESDRMPSKAMVEELCKLEESPWPAWNKCRGLDQNALAKLLKDFEIRSSSVRLPDNSTPKGYRLDQFRDAFDRYLPESADERDSEPATADSSDPPSNQEHGPKGGLRAATPPQPNNDVACSPIDRRNAGESVAAANHPATQQPSDLWRRGGLEAVGEEPDAPAAAFEQTCAEQEPPDVRDATEADAVREEASETDVAPPDLPDDAAQALLDRLASSSRAAVL